MAGVVMLVTVVLYAAGLYLIGDDTTWRVALGVFVCIWAHNCESHNES